MKRSPEAAHLRGLAAAFVAGALAVPLVHQPVLWMLHERRWVPWVAFSLERTAPFGVPAVVSATLWGGAWGLPLALLLRGAPSPQSRWVRAAVFGAIAPNVVGALLMHFGHGEPPARDRATGAILSAVVINACWALGTAALLDRYADRA